MANSGRDTVTSEAQRIGRGVADLLPKRGKGDAMKKVTRLKTRDRKPDEIPTARVAIRNFCRACMGYQPTLVKGCTDPACWLYPWRVGTPPELKIRLSEAGLESRRRSILSARMAQNGVSAPAPATTMPPKAKNASERKETPN